VAKERAGGLGAGEVEEAGGGDLGAAGDGGEQTSYKRD
jgi:hypothetical protein